MVPGSEVSRQAVDIINIIDICQRLSVLPRAGGLLDQDKLFVLLLQNVLVWRQQREELDRAKANAKTPARR